MSSTLFRCFRNPCEPILACCRTFGSLAFCAVFQTCQPLDCLHGRHWRQWCAVFTCRWKLLFNSIEQCTVDNVRCYWIVLLVIFILGVAPSKFILCTDIRHPTGLVLCLTCTCYLLYRVYIVAQITVLFLFEWRTTFSDTCSLHIANMWWSWSRCW